MEIRKLPINDKPSIYTCIHHAYPVAIIESKELAFINIVDYSETKWNTITNGTSIRCSKDDIVIYDNLEDMESDTIFWGECEGIRELIVKIDYIKQIDTSYFIDFFAFGTDLESEILAEDKSRGFRWNPFGIFIGKKMYYYDTKVYVYIKIQCINSGIVGFTSKDGKEWRIIGEIICDESKRSRLGIHYHAGKNRFSIWKKMNLIQLTYNEDDPYKGIYLDYFCFPRKNIDNSYFWFGNFIDTYYDVIYDVLDCFDSIHTYIRWNICHQFYVNICLDEFYVPERSVYGKEHYKHYNLFYGFNDEEKVYYVMGYGVKSIPVVSMVPYDVLTEENILSENLIRYKFSTSTVNPLQFNLQVVKNGIYELLNDIDSSEKYAGLCTNENLVYGLSILKKFVITEKGKKNIRNDKRIAFGLCEHARLMKERIEFLIENDYLRTERAEELIYKADKAVQITKNLLGLILKNSMKTIETKIIDHTVMDLYDTNKSLYQMILEDF